MRNTRKSPTGISSRVQHCVRHIERAEWEGALVHLFPAIDKSAQKRSPAGDGVGRRVRAFLEEEEILISLIANGGVFARVSWSAGSGQPFRTITDALYKFGRNALVHNAQLDSKLKFNDGQGLSIGPEGWNLPTGYIVGMVLAVVVAPENSGELLVQDVELNVFGERRGLNSLWGQREELRGLIALKLGKQDLFPVGAKEVRPLHQADPVPVRTAEQESDEKVAAEQRRLVLVCLGNELEQVIRLSGANHGISGEGGSIGGLARELVKVGIVPRGVATDLFALLATLNRAAKGAEVDARTLRRTIVAGMEILESLRGR